MRRLAQFALAGLVCLSTQARADLVTTAIDNATIQPGGPRSGTNGKRFFNMEGSVNGSFASYGVIDFKFAAAPAQPAFTALTLALFQSNASFTANGGLNFYLDTNTTADIQPGTSPLLYAGTGEGTSTNVANGQLTLLSLGAGAFTQATNGAEDDFTFALSPSLAAILKTDVQNNAIVRLVVTPGTAGVAATYAGATNTTPERLTLTTAVTAPPTATPEPASIAILALGLALLAPGLLASRRA